MRKCTRSQFIILVSISLPIYIALPSRAVPPKSVAKQANATQNEMNDHGVGSGMPIVTRHRKVGINWHAPKRQNAVTLAQNVTGDSAKPNVIANAETLNNEGADEMSKGNFDAAAEKFKSALQADPQCEAARRNLSAVLNNKATTLPPEEAVSYWRKALFISPENKTAQKNLATFFRSIGKNPESFDDHMQLSDEFAKKGDYVSAIVEAREALVCKQDQMVLHKLKDLMKKAPSLPD